MLLVEGKNLMIIKTPRLILRKLKIEDAKNIYDNISDYDIIKWLEKVPWPYTINDAKNWINLTIKEYKKKEIEIFKLGIEKDNEIIGAIGVHDIKKGHKCEIGYWISKKYQKQGLMSEALTYFLRYIIKEFKLVRIQSRFFENNMASQKTLEKQGFVKEGFMINDAKPRGKLVNIFIYAKIIR